MSPVKPARTKQDSEGGVEEEEEVEGTGFYQLHDKSGTWSSRLVGYEL